MCGRFTLTAPESTLRDRIGPAEWSARHTPRWNVAPGQDVLAVGEDAAGRRVEAVRWGFSLPGRARPLVNVRVETAALRSLFRDALESGRCVVPADGFYEWQGRGGQPYLVSAADGRLFGLAAIRSPDGPLAILTRSAVPAVASIHARMPVMLEAGSEWDAWLMDGARAATRAWPSSDLVSHPVGRRVNSVLNDDPQCAQPVPVEPRQMSFW